MGKGITRREILKSLLNLPMTVPLAQFAQIMVNGMIQKAWAQSLSVSGVRYIRFEMFGAPPRWTFDHFLTPYNTSKYTSNPQLGTAGVSSSGRYTSVTYETILRSGIHVPPVWGINVPNPSGGTRPLSGLLPHMLAVRGIDTMSPAHTFASKLSYQPLGAQWTIPGLVAEAGLGFPIRALNHSVPYYVFSARTPISPTRILANRGQQTGSDLLNPFQSNASPTFLTHKMQLASQLNAAAATLDAFAQAQHPGAKLLRSAQADAEAIMSGAIQTLLTKWDTIYTKYDNLAHSVLRTASIPGVTDRPVGAAIHPTSGAARLPYQIASGLFVNNPANLNEMITANTRMTNTVTSFALAELILTENLCNSASLSFGPLQDLTVNGTTFDSTFDEHFVGSLVSLVINTRMFAAIGACMAELVQVLKTKGIFNSSVLHLASEFNRAPSSDQHGSQHGYQGANHTFFTGRMNSPLIIGDIMRNSPTAYPGTWGFHANSFPGRPIDNADLNNAIATLLGLPEVVRRPADQQLIRRNPSGEIASLIGLADQI